MTKIILNKNIFEILKKRGLIKEQDELPKQFQETISKLLHSRTQSHIYHFQSKSYAEHEAFDDYYNGIVDLIDEMVESYQGQYGIIKTYDNYTLNVYKNSEQVISYFEGLAENVEDLRSVTDGNFLQGKLDDVLELINSTIYKLKNLK
jgi:DNA-binding ferritin-like protein